jgi:hypothetical protein
MTFGDILGITGALIIAGYLLYGLHRMNKTDKKIISHK